MANTTVADAAAPRTPPHNVDSRPDSTPLAVSSTTRQGEEDGGQIAIFQKVYKIAQGDKEGNVNHHIPEMVWFHKFEDPSMANTRKLLELKCAERGKRVLHIIVSRELRLITTLSGRTFLSAWWHIVVCHYALRGRNVRHRNISPSNLVVYKTSVDRYIGVPIDFDFDFLSTRDGPSSQERTGTVPFMAIELLMQKGIKGKVKHMYWHDAELLILVLTWVSLRHQDGQLLHQGRPLDEWLNVDAVQCRTEETDFLYMCHCSSRPSLSHTDSWSIARSALRCVGLFYVGDRGTFLTDTILFETWVQRNIHRLLSPELLDV